MTCRHIRSRFFASIGVAALSASGMFVPKAHSQSGPLPNLTPAQLSAFEDGREAFLEVEELEEGLGPVFNEKSCGGCHSLGGVGGAGDLFDVRAGRLQSGVFDSLTSQGGQLFDLFSVADLSGVERQEVPDCTLARGGEPVPASANVVASRRTTSLFGLGFVDATPDQTFIDLAASQPASIRGHVNMVFNISAGRATVGKFGWKAQVPTLFQFSGDAYLNEMGITSPQFPVEQPPLGNASLVAACDLMPDPEDGGDDIQAFTDFMTMLSAPSARQPNAATQVGDAVFTRIGCDGCHVRTLVAGASPIAAINNQAFHPFSDFLLHDMGSMGDNIGDNGLAGPTEMRTAPLWGLRLVAPRDLVHDGRAASLTDAILRHAGQAQASRDAYAALSSSDQDKLVAFLNSI